MDVTELTFGLKDVLAIVVGVFTLTGIYFGIKGALSNMNNNMAIFKENIEEELDNEKKSKQDYHAILANSVEKLKEELKDKESKIYTRISDIREEYKEDSNKLSGKVDSISLQMAVLNTNLSELTGYIKGKNEKTK